MFRSRQNKRIKFLLIFFILLILSILCVFLLKNKLSQTSKVDADILIVEGWISPSEFPLVVKEFRKGSYKMIVTTGMKSTADYFEIYSNGTLTFNLREKLGTDSLIGAHKISVKAFSSMGGVNSSSFNVIVNDSVYGSFLAGKRKRDYSTEWTGYSGDIDSVSVKLLNYEIDSLWERTLFVRELVIDNKVTVPYGKNSFYSFPSDGRTIRLENKSGSYAEFTRQNLIALGIDSSKIIAVPGERVKINRTLSSALAFTSWLKSSSIKVTGINIVTVGVHAERTLMTYRRLLHGKYNIGVISLPDYRARNSFGYEMFRAFREIIEIGYYWLILIFYN